MNNFKKYSLLFTFVIMGFFAFSQTPTPLSSLQRSASPRMIMSSNDSRYASYQFFTPFWGDTVRAIIEANPQWLGTFLPSGAVNINASGNNLIFTNGGINSWATDTTAGNWIMQYFLSPASSAGSGQIGARNYLTGKRYGLQFDGATGTRLQSNTDIYLQDKRVQDTLLTPGYRYFPSVAPDSTSQRTGVLTWIRSDSIANLLSGGVGLALSVTGKAPNRNSASFNFKFGRDTTMFDFFGGRDGHYFFGGDAGNWSSFGYVALDGFTFGTAENISASPAAFTMERNGGSVKTGLLPVQKNWVAFWQPKQLRIAGSGLPYKANYYNVENIITTIDSVTNNTAFASISYRMRTYLDAAASNPELVETGYLNVTPSRDIGSAFLPDTRNDAGFPSNIVSVLGTGNSAKFIVNPLSETNAANAYNSSDTTQYPAGSTRAVRKLTATFGIPNANYSLQGDSVIVFPVAGVYEVNYFVNSYDATGAVEMPTAHRVVNQAGTMSSTAQVRQRSGLSVSDQNALSGTFQVQFTGSAPFQTKVVITNNGANLLITDACQINVKRIY